MLHIALLSGPNKYILYKYSSNSMSLADDLRRIRTIVLVVLCY